MEGIEQYHFLKPKPVIFNFVRTGSLVRRGKGADMVRAYQGAEESEFVDLGGSKCSNLAP